MLSWFPFVFCISVSNVEFKKMEPALMDGAHLEADTMDATGRRRQLLGGPGGSGGAPEVCILARLRMG